MGWSPTFSKKVRGIVLPGYTAFSAGNARAAARHMLAFGMIRIKQPLDASGKGQAVIATIDVLDALLESIPPKDFCAYGLVLEANLRQVTTLNIGQITVENATLTYFGRQRQAMTNEGLAEYGGSDLLCVRGGWDALEEYPMAADIRIGVTQARMYDDAMSEYQGSMASRRNYDVGQGIDDSGRWRSGVLESSWRVGGASGAEIAALTAFLRDPAVHLIEASTVTEFGADLEVPQNATIHFHGHDPQAGPMIRYTVVTQAMRNAG